MHTKLYHIRFDALADAQAAARQLDGVKGVLVVGVSQGHSHGPEILVLRLEDGVSVEELSAEAPALQESGDWQAFDMEAPATGRIVPVMSEEDDGSENV